MALTLDELWHIPEVVCAASEEEKAESIFIAMRESLFTTLVTTAVIGKKLLHMYSKEKQQKRI